MATYNFFFKKIDDKELKIKGLGKASVNKFKKLGVETLYDLLYFFPRAYEDRSNSKDIKNVLADEFVVVKGIVVDLKNQYIKAGRTMFRAILKDDTSVLELVWFNNKFIKNNIIIGDELLVYGKIKKTAKLQMINPEYRKIKTDGSIIGKNSEQILPIYPSTASLRQEAIRKVIYEALIDYGYLLEENIPLEMIKKEKLISRKEAVMKIWKKIKRL